jgi:RNA polymerase sigma factor (sigma-70 family)
VTDTGRVVSVPSAFQELTMEVPSIMLRRRPPTDDLSDEALLSGLALGLVEMEVAFVRRFQRRVYGLAFSLVGDAGVAEDIAQEALLRAWRHASMFDARRGSAATWLLTITRNLAIDSLRLRRAVPADPGDLIGLPDMTKGPDDSAVDGDSAGWLRSIITTLPVEQRRALVLAAFYGRTAQEISVSEQIPLGTAKTRIRAAMIKLRAAVSEERDLP